MSARFIQQQRIYLRRLLHTGVLPSRRNITVDVRSRPLPMPDNQAKHWTLDPRAGTDASPVPLTPNQHWTVDPETGRRCVDFDFIEEPLGMPAGPEFGGFPQFDFGEIVGRPEEGRRRYSILRKLGWGMTSSVWLVQEQKTKQYYALKAITGHYTEVMYSIFIEEREILQRLTAMPSPHCMSKVDQFYVPGKGTSGNRHFCLITPLLGGDIRRYFISKKSPRVPLLLAKRILLHVLRALVNMHMLSMIHTDVKPDNVFFSTSLSDEDISRFLLSDPSRRHPAEASWDGIVRTAVSQPLPYPPMEDLARCTFVLGDVGSTQLTDERSSDIVCPENLRPPEIYLGGPWDEKVDIWSFGCLIYDLVTGVPLFKREAANISGVALDPTEALLVQMIAHSYDEFDPEQLAVSKHAGEYFNEFHRLKKEPKNYHYATEQFVLRETGGTVSEHEASEVVRFMRRCLKLNPTKRASAEELLEDEWFRDAA